jgi:hypothetical protein
MAEVLGHGLLDLEADHAAAPALLQRGLVEAYEVLGLLLELDVESRMTRKAPCPCTV